jgi:hypothetical protein
MLCKVTIHFSRYDSILRFGENDLRASAVPEFTTFTTSKSTSEIHSSPSFFDHIDAHRPQYLFLCTHPTTTPVATATFCRATRYNRSGVTNIVAHHPPQDNNRNLPTCLSKSILWSLASTVCILEIVQRPHAHDGTGPFTMEVSQSLKIRNPNSTPVAFKVRRSVTLEKIMLASY